MENRRSRSSAKTSSSNPATERWKKTKGKVEDLIRTVVATGTNMDTMDGDIDDKIDMTSA